MQEYAVKGNREIAVTTETERAQLIKLGYDIVDKNGNLLAAGNGKTVSYAQYEALRAENEELRAEIETLRAETEKQKKK